ncbi:MAG: hypothetical protein WC879_02605 [Melioribacteraceae bacterium]
MQKLKQIILFSLLIISAVTLSAQPKMSKINSSAGAFSRIGFGPRGIAMGNSLSAVKEGNLISYYNPAVSVFQNGNSFQSGYSFLSLDRKLNFVSFTRRFDFYSKKDSALENRKPRTSAGLNVGLINSGVSNIDERDNQGFKKGTLTTSENQFFISVAIKFSEKVAAGFSTKFYYYKLYQDITSTGLGFDLGLLYSYSKNMIFSFVFSDLNSKYKWDSSPLYDIDGSLTENKFPTGKKIGMSYRFDEYELLTSSEFYFDNYGTKTLRLGVEYNPINDLFFRAGIDNYQLTNGDEPVKPSFGIGYAENISNIVVGFDYAFMFEPYSSKDRHIMGIHINF